MAYKINKYTKNKKKFNFLYSTIFEFAECYKKIVYGRKHNHSLYRSPDNKKVLYFFNFTKSTTKLTVSKLQWLNHKITSTPCIF